MSKDDKKNEPPEFPEKPPLNFVQGYRHEPSNLLGKSSTRVKEKSMLYRKRRTGSMRALKRKK